MQLLFLTISIALLLVLHYYYYYIIIIINNIHCRDLC